MSISVAEMIPKSFATTFMALLILSGISCSSTKNKKAEGVNEWLAVQTARIEPATFESYLKDHPEDEGRRAAALVWYSRREKNPEKLREHTLAMIQYHPDNMQIYFANVTAYYVKPEYRREVIWLLQERVKTVRANHGAYWVLAEICQQGAIPPVLETAADRNRLLRYYRLPPETEIPEQIDDGLAEIAVAYYRKAMALTTKDKFHFAFYSQQLAELLDSLKRYDEAVEVCREALPRADDTIKPDLIVYYGACLWRGGHPTEAKRVLGAVRSCDKEGFENGPAHATHDAETTLGLIALDSNDVEAAKSYLLASCKVQKCCHNTTKGMRLDLARRLLASGEPGAVAEYCQIVLRDFTPDQEETQALLQQAQEKQAQRK